MSWPYSTRLWRDHVRPAVLQRDGHTCRRCRRHSDQLAPTERLIADHIRSWREPGVDPFDMANLQTLCSTCSGKKDGPRAGAARPGRSRGMQLANVGQRRTPPPGALTASPRGGHPETHMGALLGKAAPSIFSTRNSLFFVAASVGGGAR